MSVNAVNSENFAQVVLQSEKPVLVDFWAEWCGPCRMLSPIVEELAQEHDELNVAKLNVDESPDLAMRYNVDAIPALLLFRGGKPVAQTVGYQPKEALEEMLRSAQ